MTKLRCIHCKYEWDYKGKMPLLAGCPSCQKRTPIKQSTIKQFSNKK